MNNPRAIQRHLVKALAAGALLAAAALPMAIASAAGAAAPPGTTYTSSFDTAAVGGTSTGAYFGTGAAGTVTITASNPVFAGDGGNASITTNAPGVTFTNVVDIGGSTLTANFASTSATAPGIYSLTVVDNANPSPGLPLGNQFQVYADPAVSSVSPTSATDTVPAFSGALTVSGSGFVGDPVVVLTSTVDGTSLKVNSTSSTGVQGTPSSSLTVNVTVENGNTLGPATPGAYVMTVINPDGGSVTTGPVFTVIGNAITTVSPSALTAVGANQTVVLTGGGFQSNAVVTFVAGCTDATITSSAVTSASSISVVLNVTSVTALRCTFQVANSGPGDNGAVAQSSAGALGFGEAGTAYPLVTGSSLATGASVVGGAPSTTITFTGMGFSSYTLPLGYTTWGSNNVPDSNALVTGSGGPNTPCLSNGAGTSLTCNVSAGVGGIFAVSPAMPTAGPHTALLSNDGTVGAFPGAFTVDGPTITSASPAALAIGAPIGTTVALTGTEFNNTTQGHVTVANADTLNGVFNNVSATSENFVVTTSPTKQSTATLYDTVTLVTTDAYGVPEASMPFPMLVNPSPTVTNTTYATGTTGVGVGATAQQVTIVGTGFESGATVTAFKNAAGAADTSVTAKVTGVNALGTQITATIAIAAGDANTIDGFTVTNPDGGVASTSAVAPAGLVIDAAPTISAVSPSTATPSATNNFTITGTGFQSGAVVTATANGTCGVATVASATSITVACTLGAAGATATSLVVMNLDGGNATSAVVLPAQTTPPAPSFHVSAVHGVAVHGKTVTITIVGTGFYGQPKITSTAKGVRAVVSKDNGKVLTVRVTTPMNVRGWHTFTVRLANGKSGKVNYLTK